MTTTREWLLEGMEPSTPTATSTHPEPAPSSVTGAKQSWWRVMCLTGVDYFSTLGYQPGIAALAAGLLSPLATVVLVIFTLGGALPIYRRVAAESPHGSGSIAMLEHALPAWRGKLLVLVLLGFAATDFLITMTLSASDATAHIVENPFTPAALRGHEVAITLVLLALLAAVFLRGFREAISIAVVLVVAFLTLNAVVIGAGLWEIAAEPEVVNDWTESLTTSRSDPMSMLVVVLLLFPRLALGLSGFETGVTVMPHLRGEATDTETNPRGRIRDAKRMLTVAALIMSVMLLSSSFVTTLLIPPEEFRSGGQANGRALAYLAHEYLGNEFGTMYDIVTVAILWFAGASAMAGMLHLVPRYLPRYGMAPHWAKAVRPLVLVLITVAFAVTIMFEADVAAQGGAYATGVLVLMATAALAVTVTSWRRGERVRSAFFALLTLAFGYTTAVNVHERPDGVRIAAFFICGIVVVSIVSRLHRAFELRTTDVEFDETAARLIDKLAQHGGIRFVANEPGARDRAEYESKTRQIVDDNGLRHPRDLLFIEVTITDPSEFESVLEVRGEVRHHRYLVLTVEATSVPSALAAVLLAVRDRTGVVPGVYLEWTERSPIMQYVRFIVLGVGDVAPLTREVLRRAETDRHRRPHVHVG